MAENSKYYYNATAKGDKLPIGGIFVFAFTPGDEYKRGWLSNSCTNKVHFTELAGRAEGARMITVAMLQSHQKEHFPVKKEYSSLAVYGFDKGAGGYMVGATITSVFNEIIVGDVQPIFGWKGLPGVYGPLMNEINSQKRRMGPVAVTFHSVGAHEVVT